MRPVHNRTQAHLSFDSFCGKIRWYIVWRIINMKKRIFFLNIFLVFILSFPVCAAEPDQIPGNTSTAGAEGCLPSDAPEITGDSGIVMDLDTGDILYAKNMYKRAEPASTTKLMTALLAVKHLSPSDKITVLDGALSGITYDAVSIGLSPGEIMSVQDLLYALLLPSANDAANVLGMAVSGTIANFAKDMNVMATSLGCKGTHFANANGLPDQNHYTTAYDMALIARAAYGQSRIRDVIRTESYWIPATNMVGERELWTTNQMLYDITDLYYEYCTGGKTGYTESAGNTMVAFAEKDSRRLVSVVFGCPSSDDRFLDSAKLLEFAFDSYHVIRPLEGFSLSMPDRSTNPVLENYYDILTHSLPEFSVDTDLTIYTRANVTADDIKKDISLNTDRTTDDVGQVTLTYKGETLSTIPIHSDRTDMTEDLSTLQLDHISRKSDDKVETIERSNIIKDVVQEYFPQMMICVLTAIGLCLCMILIVKHKQKKRVNIRRYFGDGPVPSRNAKDDQEEVQEFEKRRAEQKMLKSIEDDGSVTRKKPVSTVLSRLTAASGDGNTDEAAEEVSLDDLVDDLPKKASGAQQAENSTDEAAKEVSLDDLVDDLPKKASGAQQADNTSKKASRKEDDSDPFVDEG